MAFRWPFKRNKKTGLSESALRALNFPSKPAKQRAYAAAQINRLTMDWVSMVTSADAEIQGSLEKVRARSRQLGRDNDYARSFFREVQNNVVGEGIRFQAQVKMQRGNKLNTAINDEIELAWDRWCRKEFCDTAGRLSFSDIERLAIRETAEAGDFYVRMIRQSFGGSKIPFALELLEAEQLDEHLNGVHTTGNEIRMGVEIDRWGRPVAYHFRMKHPGDYQHVYGVESQTKHQRIPANEIIPLFISERAKQTRGVPWMASAILRLHQMGGYEDAEIIAARATASLMGFIETPEGELKGDDIIGDDRVTDFEPGVFKYLGPGERVTVPDLKRPGGQFDPFMRIMLRGVAAGVGASYETISRDYSQSNYSSSRMALLSERDNWRAIQKWIIRNFHQPVFEAWLDMAVLSGAISLPGYELNPEKFQGVKWMPRGWAWVDPQKEVAAYKEAIKGGLTTMTEVVSQTGGDIEDMMTQRKREMDMADDLGLIFDTDASITPNGQVVGEQTQTDPNNANA